MKKKFIFHFTAESGVSLNDRTEHQRNVKNVFSFKFQEDEVYIQDNVEEIDGLQIFCGLNLFISCEDLSEEKATEKAKNRLELVLSLMSFVSLSYIGPARLLCVLDTKQNEKKGFDIKFVVATGKYNDWQSLTKLNQETFTEVWGKLDKLDNKSRILRSISWLRKGFNEKSIDQFIAYFIGVEILSKPLNMLFDDNPKKSNSSFFKTLFNRRKTSRQDQWSGVRRVFEEYLSFDKFKKIKDKRSEILHGYKKLDKKLVEEAESYINILKRGFLTSLCLLMGVDQGPMDQIVDQRWAKFRPSRWTVLKGSLNKIPDQDLSRMIHSFPRIEPKVEASAKEINANGEMVVNEKVKYTTVIPEGIELNIESHEIRAEDNSGIIKAEVKKTEVLKT